MQVRRQSRECFSTFHHMSSITGMSIWQADKFEYEMYTVMNLGYGTKRFVRKSIDYIYGIWQYNVFSITGYFS